MASEAPPRFRFFAIDLLRGIALVCMIVFHFSWDLEFFGLANLGVTENPLWLWFAKCIAGTFLFTVGISLYLAHGSSLRRDAFLKRLLIIAVAATAITVASYFFDADSMIWFGILHCIAVSSALALVFLRLSVPVTAIAAIAAYAAPHFLTTSALNHPGWLWLGLSEEFPPADDYIPLLPWFGNVLLGIAFAKVVLPLAPLKNLTAWQPGSSLSRALVFAGQHSLIVYLVHQPLLILTLWLVTQITG